MSEVTACKPYSPGTVGDWTSRNLAAVLVIERYGIDFHSQADLLLEEVCAVLGVDADRVKADIEAVTKPRGVDGGDFESMPLRMLIAHIIERHHEYLKLELPRLRVRLDKMASRHGERDGRLLERLHAVFVEFQAELQLHMHKEEMALFPVIERYESAAEMSTPAPPPPFGTVMNPVAVMEREHDSALLALSKMREITRDYVPADYACANFRAVFRSLEELEADLTQHIHLENDILFPRGAELEKRLFGKG